MSSDIYRGYVIYYGEIPGGETLGYVVYYEGQEVATLKSYDDACAWIDKRKREQSRPEKPELYIGNPADGRTWGE